MFMKFLAYEHYMGGVIAGCLSRLVFNLVVGEVYEAFR